MDWRCRCKANLLKLIVIVTAWVCIYVKTSRCCDRHVPAVSTEITESCILNDLWKYYTSKPFISIHYDTLADQDCELTIGTSSQVVNILLLVEEARNLSEGVSWIKQKVIGGRDSNLKLVITGSYESQKVLISVIGLVYIDSWNFGLTWIFIVIEPINPLWAGFRELSCESGEVLVIRTDRQTWCNVCFDVDYLLKSGLCGIVGLGYH